MFFLVWIFFPSKQTWSKQKKKKKPTYKYIFIISYFPQINYTNFRLISGGLKCSSDVQVQCGSLFPGHHQDCPVADARGGWLQCLDLTETLPGSVPCQERDYGIHRDNVWVQNGCQGNFYTCYIPGTFTFICSNSKK